MSLPPTSAARLHRVVVVAYPTCQSLDLMGVIEVFADANRQAEATGLPKQYSAELAAPNVGLVETSSGIPLMASLSIDRISGPIDTLIVGSGSGAREAAEDSHAVAELRRLAVTAKRVAAVCTGAFPLAATGLLDGRNAATHWARCKQLAQRFPEVTVDADAIFVTDGKFHTSAGGTAGIDLALALVENDLGRQIALAIARQLVVFLKRPGGQSQFSGHMMAQIEGENSERFAALGRWMLENLDSDLSVDTLAARVAMSPRNFARRFREAMGTTPAQYVQRLRIDVARRLLTEGEMQTGEVAARCGFGSLETMRVAFHRHVHVAPQQFRARFRRTDSAPNSRLRQLLITGAHLV
jgi:transcriptional regulator GlxA family with amidase domain